MSLYEDAAAHFVRPIEAEFLFTNHILKFFEDASGLKTNLSKT
jgi:hypothetical protein